MQNIPKFNHSFWYSGFDGQYFAELLPAQFPQFWFIEILGEQYFVTSEIAIDHRHILSFLITHKFKFDRATWQQERTIPFAQNPFLISAPINQAIAISQSGTQSLPQTLTSSSVKIFATLQPKTLSAYIYFIVTEDYQYLKIGFSKNPSSRFSELQTSHPQTLIYLGSLSSDRDKFMDICEKFSYLLIRKGWFSFSSELREYVEGII